jgi:uncharacterized cupin superfamily protein
MADMPPQSDPDNDDSAAVAPDTPESMRRRLVRNVDEVTLERQSRDPLYDTRCGGLSDQTAARKLGAGYDVLAPGKRSCPYHYHLTQEELFVILEGQGSLRVAGQLVPVRAGDVVFIPPGPEYPHQFINTSSEPMRYLSISTQERPELCVYPDSGKWGVFAPGHAMLQRPAASLDYWDGEP